MGVSTLGDRVGRLRRHASARRLGWGVADQAVSSVENFVLGVFVARSLGATSLGALSLALFTYAIIVNASRGASTDPLMVRFSGAEESRWRAATKGATGTALVVGLLGGAGVALVALGLRSMTGPSEVDTAFLALAVGLPGLVLQDSWRYAFFAAGRGARAFLNDVVWTVLLFAVLAASAGHLESASGAVLAFGATATAAAVFGAWQARALPNPGRAAGWIREHRDLGGRFVVENVTLGVSGSARSYVVAGRSGLAAAGGVRGAEMLVGPVAALLMGVAQVAVPEVVRALHRGHHALRRTCRLLSGGLAAMSAAWGAFVLLVLPLGLGELLLGGVWPSAYALLPAMVVSVTVGCTTIGPSAGLRALGRADRTMRIQFVASGLYIGLGVLGALLWGALGTVWGTALAALLSSALWWYEFRAAARQHVAGTAPHAPLGDEHGGIAPHASPQA